MCIRDSPVTFTVRHGKHAGKEVSFNVKNPGTGGKLKESWHKLPTKKSVGGVEAEVVNTQFYASYWNDGHRIVTKKGGPIKGFVKGTHVLEKMKSRIDHQMVKNFEAEVKAVQAKMCIRDRYKAIKVDDDGSGGKGGIETLTINICLLYTSRCV